MKRKLIKQGAGGLTVCLPKKWTDANNLKPGNEVNIEEDNNGLVLTGYSTKPIKEKTINLGGYGLTQVRSVIASAYKAGYSQINLKSVPQSSNINEIINTFTGLEIIFQSKDQAVIKSFLTTEPKEIENLIIKMFQIIKSFEETIIEEWGNIDQKYLESARTNIQKLRDHCLRSINLTKFGGDKTYDYYDLVTSLEKLMSKYKSIAEYIIRYKPKKSATLKEIFFLFSQFYDAFLNKSFTEAEKVWVYHHKWRKELLKPELIKKNKDEFFVFYYAVMEELQHVSSRILSINT